MAQLTISQVARRVGLRPSAIRYYEQIKVLPAAPRISGRRKYDQSAVYQLTVLRRAQQVGFTLAEIRQLFSGFEPAVALSIRWRRLAEAKQLELNAQLSRIQGMKDVLKQMQTRCQCQTISECGAKMLSAGA